MGPESLMLIKVEHKLSTNPPPGRCHTRKGPKTTQSREELETLPKWECWQQELKVVEEVEEKVQSLPEYRQAPDPLQKMHEEEMTFWWRLYCIIRPVPLGGQRGEMGMRPCVLSKRDTFMETPLFPVCRRDRNVPRRGL